MRKLYRFAAVMLMVGGVTNVVVAGDTRTSSPEEDRRVIKKFYADRFPDVAVNDYVDGIYALDKLGRENWEAIEEFPPYELFVDEGEGMWNTPLANGKTYSDCFPDGPAIAHKYPHWDKKKGMVTTLPLAINNCREANGSKPLKYKKGSINNILSYIAFESRGKVTNVVIPEDDPRAMAAYEDGKRFYFTRRGQLNFSCASCHMESSGRSVRTEMLSPSLGHTTHWPTYRSKWGTVGTLHRRFTGCNKNIRAKPMKAQGPEYRNLEYFLTYMSNGLALNGPGARK